MKYNEVEMDKKDFSIGLNPFGPPPGTYEKIEENVRLITDYPEFEDVAIKSVGDFLGLRERYITIENASELFRLLPYIFKIETALIPIPMFWKAKPTPDMPYQSYQHIPNEKIIVTKPSSSFELDLELLDKELCGVPFAYLCNPNNPTSQLVESKEMIRLIKKHSEVTFVVDETHLLFREDYPHQTLNREVVKLKNLVVITSLSKFFHVPGLRLGFVTGSEGIIKSIKYDKLPYATSTLSLIALPHILGNKDYIEKTRRYIMKEKERFSHKLNEVSSLEVFPPATNLLLCRITQKEVTVAKLENRLEQKGFHIRSCSGYEGLGPEYFRIGVMGKIENNQLIEEIKKVL